MDNIYRNSKLNETLTKIFLLFTGLPKGVVNVVYGKGDVVGKALSSCSVVKALAFVSMLLYFIYVNGYVSNKFCFQLMNRKW